MAWKDLVTITGLAEGAKTVWVLLGQKEVAHVQVERTDTGSADRMVVELWSSVDAGTTISDAPLWEIEVAASDDIIDFSVFGVYSFAIGQRAVGTTDIIVATVRYRLDNGLVV